jgi:hypothetical protein
MGKLFSVVSALRLWCVVILTVAGAITIIAGISSQTAKAALIATAAQDR